MLYKHNYTGICIFIKSKEHNRWLSPDMLFIRYYNNT